MCSSKRDCGRRAALLHAVGALAVLAITTTIAGAEGTPVARPTATPVPALAPAEIPARVLAGQRLVRDLRPLVAATDDLATKEQDLDSVSTLVDGYLGELDGDTARTGSRRVLDDLRAEILHVRTRLKASQDDLAVRSTRLGDGVERVESELEVWQATRAQSWFATLPRALAGQIGSCVADLKRVAADLEQRVGRLLGLQTRLSEVQARLDQALERVTAEAESRTRGMLTLDAPPLWHMFREQRSLEGFGGQIAASTTRSAISARSYVALNRHAIAIQLVAWIVLVLFLSVARRHTPIDAEVLTTGPKAAILRRPGAAALLLTVTLGQVAFHRDAPSAWNDVVALLILMGAARFLPVLLAPAMRRVLRGLAGLAVLHWLAYLVSERLPIDRLLWFALSLVGAVVLPRLGAWTVTAIGDRRPRLAAAERSLARICGGTLALASAANLVGAFTLATIIANAALVSLYLSVLMWTLAEIADGLVVLLLRSGLSQRSRILRDRGAQVRATTGRVTGFFAIVGWAAGSAAEIGTLGPTLRIVRTALTASVSVGELTLSAGSVLLFALVLWLAFQLSRLLRFVFGEEVVARVDLPQGVPAALSTLTHYVVIVVGFLIAVAAIGLDLTSFALVAGALGVGIGFGLQTVVNNFVSGLILLFERPIRVGDKVQLGQMAGTVTAIGIRASTVRTWEGAEVVVPNGSLLESELINWTLSDATRRIEVRVGVAYGTEPERVLPVLTAAATAHPKVLAEPAPVALFIGFGDSSLDFSLRAWCQFDDQIAVGSDLHVAVNRALAEAGIEIPFPQRDVHVRTVPPERAREESGSEADS